MLIATLAVVFAAQEPEVEPRPPNVVVIVCDDMGSADFGISGSSLVETPNMDRLAYQGTRFVAGYSTATVGGPARAGLISGRYQQRFGFTNQPSDAGAALPGDERTLAERLNARGYRTGAFGSWGLGSEPEARPTARGFDEFFGLLGSSRTPRPLAESQLTDATRLRHNGEAAAEEGYLTDRFGAAAAEFIERNAKEPLFVYLSFCAAQSPLIPKAGAQERFEHLVSSRARRLAAVTKSVDDAVGRVLAAIDANQLTRDTLVILVGDNGGAAENGADNRPYRGYAGDRASEGGLRVPFFLSWPSRIPAGIIERRPVSTLDIAATAMSAAADGLIDLSRTGLDGKDLLPMLLDDSLEAPHDALFWHRENHAAIRRGPWKLLRVGETTSLFHLEQDERELTDLAAEHPEVAAELNKVLAAWESTLAKPRWPR